MPSHKMLFIVNPISGFRRDKSDLINRIHAQFPAGDIELTAAPGEATRLAGEAARRGYHLVAAVGGDGTVNEVASGLVGTDTALGIIPRGSGNGLARGLGIPLAPAGSLQVLRAGQVRTIDVGCAAHRHFFAVCGVGFDANVGRKFNAATWRGPLPYFLIAAQEFVDYKPEPLRLHVKHQQWEKTPFLITIANTRQYGNGAIIAPQAQPDDGLLDMCVVEPLRLLDALKYAPRLFNGTIDRAPIISYQRVQEITIAKDGPILFHVDGEATLCEGPLKISIKPRALRVITPCQKT
ncbi:MAG: diacylglycerol kinase family lipid kinase [candidate division KSB1 bacterium]|nr:diacylglycerol kinase family lipid kinase [candidate division KSB1 bacterium]MDZ7273951.1 diacylglycerol kinase family lipid kinase [candidate division KSB1 bacterium]MDZ7286107.1 diacylglycerol kinase family lipid kinase [candidate division KSB1 bacterium]MDZ7299139.1 diacylglycerol kinase family lipid kinase [candidate division KSB1 bacterium]MDZ7308336.1 diacylglycerol kinase family lipid kinase [candidate division KSB1 bacterium]